MTSENPAPQHAPGTSASASAKAKAKAKAEPDAIFADPRLAACYDTVDGERDDLDHYETILAELGARTVVDVGCGTGALAVRLAADGLSVTGVDPALASLEVARTKLGAGRVDWIHGTAESLPALDPPLLADAAVMTGNVAQVFVTDEAWASTLQAIRAVVREGGHVVFEARRPERRAWEEWQADTAESVHEVPGLGRVRSRPTRFDVDLPLVTFADEFLFADGTTITSTSTLRWRSETELRDSLAAAGFAVQEIRDAPDRPGREFVVIARAA
ncbi:class I SAM-dependent methyltransferase [Brachybacterium tyrofermentans]|uniref:Class I SAM-dependent methyltransferase n=1 Tax=Brachybacterium tyrofermentans TaxID=47848 RepID=A0ABW0FCG7_9MICO